MRDLFNGQDKGKPQFQPIGKAPLSLGHKWLVGLSVIALMITLAVVGDRYLALQALRDRLQAAQQEQSRRLASAAGQAHQALPAAGRMQLAKLQGLALELRRPSLELIDILEKHPPQGLRLEQMTLLPEKGVIGLVAEGESIVDVRAWEQSLRSQLPIQVSLERVETVQGQARPRFKQTFALSLPQPEGVAKP